MCGPMSAFDFFVGKEHTPESNKPVHETGIPAGILKCSVLRILHNGWDWRPVRLKGQIYYICIRRRFHEARRGLRNFNFKSGIYSAFGP